MTTLKVLTIITVATLAIASPACEPGGRLHGRLRPNDRCLFFGE
jgi:hypothetical protein